MRLPSVLVLLALVGFGCGTKQPETAPPAAGVAPTAQPATQPAGEVTPAAPAADPLTLFFDQGYRYCDAVLLGAAWGVEPYEAKIRMGERLQGGDRAAVESKLGTVRAAAREGTGRACTFVETGFTSADAERLADAWVGSVSEAKALIVSKVHWGNYEGVERLLSQAAGTAARHDGPDEQARRAFFDSDRVDYCHAKMLAAAWGSEITEAKTILGHKVMAGRWDLLDGTLQQARDHAQAHPAAQCDFIDTSFTSADAQALAQAWETTVTEAKAALARKYLFGIERDVRDELRGRRGG